jgi:hypothetical protein
MTGAILLAAGTVGTPAISFAGDTDNGFYHIGANNWAAVANGAAVVTYAAGAVTNNGTFACSGAATFSSTAAFSGKVTTTPSASGGAGFNLPHGAAPTAPTNGDAWTTTSGFFVRINGVTQQMGTGSGGVTTFNTRSGAVVLSSADVTTALTYTPVNPSSIGTAAAQNTGTSGANVPLLNGALTWSGGQTYSGAQTANGVATFNAGADIPTPLTTPTTTEAGYMGVPQNVQAGNYTLVLADRGKEIYKTATSTLTIPANASVAFPIGATALISAGVGATVTIAINSDTLRFVPSNVTGSRTLVGPGTAVIQKKTAAEWWIRGDVT